MEFEGRVMVFAMFLREANFEMLDLKSKIKSFENLFGDNVITFITCVCESLTQRNHKNIP